MKFVLNIVLLPILGIEGAVIASIISQIVSVLIIFAALKKNIDIKFGVGKFLIKPLIASSGMIFFADSLYGYLVEIFHSVFLAFGVSIFFGAILYGLLIIILGILSKEDYALLPYGEKIFRIFSRKAKC